MKLNSNNLKLYIDVYLVCIHASCTDLIIVLNCFHGGGLQMTTSILANSFSIYKLVFHKMALSPFEAKSMKILAH